MKQFAILIPLFPPLISILVPAILDWLRPRGLGILSIASVLAMRVVDPLVNWW